MKIDSHKLVVQRINDGIYPSLQAVHHSRPSGSPSSTAWKLAKVDIERVYCYVPTGPPTPSDVVELYDIHRLSTLIWSLICSLDCQCSADAPLLALRTIWDSPFIHHINDTALVHLAHHRCPESVVELNRELRSAHR